MRGAIAAEWTKTWTVRSTYWCLVAAVLLMVGMVVPNGLAIRGQLRDGVPGANAWPATQLPIEATVYLVQFAVIALVALLVAGEYGTGQVRTTLQWVPVRWRVPASKSLALASAMAVVSLPLTALGVWLADLTMAERGLPYSAADFAGTCLLVALYTSLMCVLTVGVATAVRSVAGTLVAMFMLIMVLPLGMQTTQFLRDLSHYVPGIAGVDLMERADTTRGAVVLVVWAAVALLAGIAVLRKRDA
ncbi:hypothetical protein V5P93_001158 [Actinokineospora auranticolor]|uniref:ABC-2 type transport system permease protein n=1 Tax=Actinokineospora auranticolor TaxID=155976 RepID=A0A2S6GUB6_9PSEU|nr:hypothetical protein [Actinokineospora auranticolor]PPK68787.1 hypothetical protein CLV40_10430 [Actinokineospora auranticolor]